MPTIETESPYAVELIDLQKRFGAVIAVNNVSFAIKKGEIFSLLGPSGCGKTTMLRMVAGFEKPDSGEIRIQNEIVNHIPPFKRECNLVFQQMALFPHMTVGENVAYGLVERKRPKAEIRDRIREMLKVVNLVEMEDRYIHQLSGGQKQRVALARSLVLKPKVLLLDEPLAALDRKLRKEMQGELRRIQREVGITFLYVTHDQKVALSLSDRIGIMCEGKVIQIGSPSEIYEIPRNRFVAKFMGACNIFNGKILRRNGNGLIFEDQHGHHFAVSACDEIDTNTRCSISVHPEIIEILPPDSTDAPEKYSRNMLRGKIADVFYQGDFTELSVRIPDTTYVVAVHLNRLTSSNIPLNEGQDVILRWDPCHSNILLD